jgi:hypothetical protein
MILTLIVLWFLLQPGDGWGWMIIGGYETRQECETARERHPLGHWLICARNERNRLGARRHRELSMTEKCPTRHSGAVEPQQPHDGSVLGLSGQFQSVAGS